MAPAAAILGLLLTGILPALAVAQAEGSSGAVLRRGAIESALGDRERRTGRLYPVSLCSIIDAIGMVDQTIGRSGILRKSSQGDPSMARCHLLPPADSAVPAGRLDITGVHVSKSVTGATLADVSLRAWQQDGSFTVEHYSLLQRSDTLWTVHKYEEYCCETIHRLEPMDRLPLIVLNERPLPPGTELRDALAALRGQVIDSIALLPGTSKNYLQYGRWGVANGVVIIGTRAAARRPE